MAEHPTELDEYLRKIGADTDGDSLREAADLVLRLLMEAEVSKQIGAQRNGHRARNWETRVGDVALRIPKLRQGTYYPSFLEPRRRAERALMAVIQSAYVQG